MAKLYRGVNRELDQQNGGRLGPRGHRASVVMRYDDGIYGMKHDGKFTYGASGDNAARAHHLKPGLHDECWVSFSRSLQVATRFATRDGEVPGFVYVVDEDLLARSGVIAKEFSDPQYPDEIEVSLRAADNRDLPLELIVAKHEFPPASMVGHRAPLAFESDL